MDYRVNEYLGLLKISLDFIKQSNSDYNQDLNNSGKKEKLHYHIYSFSQILYGLRDRLICENPDRKLEVENFFQKNNTATTPVGVSLKLANEWKHEEGFKVIQQFSEMREIAPGVITPTKVALKLPQTHQYDNQAESLVLLFERAYSQVSDFCDEFK